MSRTGGHEGFAFYIFVFSLPFNYIFVSWNLYRYLAFSDNMH
jgi:hypothetical protein